MKTKSFLKVWLLCVNFENFTSINEDRDQSQSSARIEGCDWPRSSFIELNFSKLTNGNQIIRNYFVCILYNLCKMLSPIIECMFFIRDFLPWTFYNNNCALYGILLIIILRWNFIFPGAIQWNCPNICN